MVKPLEANLIVSNVLLSRYRLVRKLGEGGMGKVFLAEQVADADCPNNVGRFVAMKFLEIEATLARVPSKDREERRKDYVQRFINEGRLGFKLAHPHIIATLDYGVDEDERPFLVSEFIEGVRPLSALIAQARYQHETSNPGKAVEHCLVPWSMIVRAGAQIADALAYMHEAQVAHRDIKPENILFTGEGRDVHVYIVDLGIAKNLAESAPDIKETGDGNILGTLANMAPEQIAPQFDHAEKKWGKGPHNDVYAFGTVIYEMMTGSSYFEVGESAGLFDIAQCIMSTPPISISTRINNPDQELELLALRCLVKQPWLRPTMAEVRDELRKLSQKQSVYPEQSIRIRPGVTRNVSADAPTVASVPPPAIPKAAAIPKELRPTSDPPPPSKTGRRAALVGLGLLTTLCLGYLGLSRFAPVATVNGLVGAPATASVSATAEVTQLPTVTIAPVIQASSEPSKAPPIKRKISPQPKGADKKIFDNGISSYAAKDWLRAEIAMRLLLDKSDYQDLPRAVLVRAESLIQLKRSDEAKPLLKQYLEYPGSAKSDLSAAARSLVSL